MGYPTWQRVKFCPVASRNILQQAHNGDLGCHRNPILMVCISLPSAHK